MDRNCNLCKSSGDQVFNSCGYIKAKRRRKKVIDFPALKSPAIHVNKCPVYYYNTFSYLYDWYNITLDSKVNISSLTLPKRIIFREFGNYLHIRKEFILERERKKKEN